MPLTRSTRRSHTVGALWSVRARLGGPSDDQQVVCAALAVRAPRVACCRDACGRRNSARAPAQTLFFDAAFTDAQTAGPGPSHVGHRQIATGGLRDANRRRAGTFSFTCTWTKVDRAGASESCVASAPDGRRATRRRGTLTSNRSRTPGGVTGGTGAVPWRRRHSPRARPRRSGIAGHRDAHTPGHVRAASWKGEPTTRR